MFLKLVRDVAKPHTFAIIDRLKRSTGLSVTELAEALKMSYMGVQQHCVELEKKGLVDTWRKPGVTGRPQKIYRLTAKSAAFFPEAGNEMAMTLLQSIRRLYGPMGPDRLLFNWFSTKTEEYLKKVRGKTPAERAVTLSRVRDAEGHCSSVEQEPDRGNLLIVEYHDPLKEIAIAFPVIRQMEVQMFQRLLQTPVERQEERAGGLIKLIYRLPEINLPETASERSNTEGDSAKPPPEIPSPA